MRERQRKVKIMSSRVYVVEAINRLVDRSCENYLEFSGLLDEQMEDRLPLKEQQKGWLSGFDAAEGLLKMKVYTGSLRNDCDTLTQIGQEICQKSRACMRAVTARYRWYLNRLGWLGYDGDSLQRSAATSVGALEEALRRIEKAGLILKEDDIPEPVRVCQLREYVKTLSEDC